MFKFIKKLFLATRYAILWVKALDLAANKKNKEAKKLLIQMEPLLKRTNPEYYLLRGYIEFCLDYKNDSLRYLDIALNNLSTTTKYSKVDTYYMEVYAKELKVMLLAGQQCFITIDYKKLELERVSKHLIDKFPLCYNS